MHYSTGLPGIGMLTVGTQLHSFSPLTALARILLDLAGGLFLLVALVVGALHLVAEVVGARDRRTRRASPVLAEGAAAVAVASEPTTAARALAAVRIPQQRVPSEAGRDSMRARSLQSEDAAR